MSENFAELQLSFDFADTDHTKIHGERQIAAPVDDSLLEDDEEENSSGDNAGELTSPSALPELPEEELPENQYSEMESEEDFHAENSSDLISEPESSALPESSSPDPLPQEPAPASSAQTEEQKSAVVKLQQGFAQQTPQITVVQKFVYSEFSRHEPVEEEHPASEPEPPPMVPAATPSRAISRQPLVFQRELQRAALAWLASGFPTAAATRVPTRLIKFRADAAAFWSTPGKNRLLQPERTVLVEARATRSSCWPECSGSEEIVPQLRLEQERRQAIEAEIRIREPHLRDSDVLFPEIEYWDYSGTRNPEYKICLRKIREYERALYRGSRFERIRRANVANELYLAVPEGLIHPNELAEGWGLLYVSRNLSVKVAKQALPRECPQENMLHLSQNIAASSLNDVLFAHGVYLSSGGKISFRRPPRRRRLEHFL